MKIVYVILLTITFFANAMENAIENDAEKGNLFGPKIKMPSAQMLHDRLSNDGFEYFMKITHIEEKLADQEKYADGIMIAVRTAYCDYSTYLKKNMNPQLYDTAMDAITKKQLLLYKLLLQHSPPALKYLETNGFLQIKK